MTFSADILDKCFVTSDYHFGSYKLDSMWKVFSKVQEDQLIEEWNKIVPRDALVLYIGDFVDTDEEDLESYKNRLNGDMILVKGNHDTFSDDIYKKHLMHVCEHLDIENLKISLRHMPYEDARPGYRKMFGHIHRCCSLEKIISPDSFCSCVMRNGYVPTKLTDILKWMDDEKTK